MIKSISFIVLTNFFQFNELKILRQPGCLLFLVKPSIFFYSASLEGFCLSNTLIEHRVGMCILFVCVRS